jgi:hypothetical protein
MLNDRAATISQFLSGANCDRTEIDALANQTPIVMVMSGNL